MTEVSGTKLSVNYCPITDLTGYDRNSRTHSPEQVAQLAASMTEFGWTNPILVDAKMGVIAGHGRILAAKSLGMTDVPVIVLGHLTAAQRRALVIADNKLALNAGWDSDLLASELLGLKDEGFDLGLLGFGDDELADLLADRTDGLVDPDDIPEPPAEPVSVLGDVWILGNHRIACGDSTDAETVAKCLNGVKPLLMVSDPPYGVEYDASWRQQRGVNKAGAGAATGKVLNDDRSDWRQTWALFPGDVAYVWHAGLHAASVAESLEVNDFQIRAQVIWNKSSMLLGRGDYHWKHEPCWYAVRKGKTGHYIGGRKQTTVWDIDKPHKSETGHSTQKPVECMKRPIENNSKPGQAVYEPFSGSGTTIIAGEMTGRHIRAIELNEAYVDVAITRWQTFTGLEAVHEETGLTFAALAAQRASEAQ
jgi:DNA modification methylase